MADADTTEAKNYATSVPMQNVPFFLKGSNNLDWGMKNRLSQIFDPTLVVPSCWPSTMGTSLARPAVWSG